MSETWSFKVNGRDASFAGDAMTRLLDVVREDLGLTGTKEGCGEGECGSCSVLLDGEVVCSCLVPVFQAEGRDVRTVEAPAAGTQTEAIQAIMVSEGGVQCGACTPGIVVTAAALFERDPHPDRAAIREALAGNLCRCTGYERIFRALEKLAGTGDVGADEGATP